MKKIILFLNAYSQGMSGADKISIEAWKLLDQKMVTIMTSLNGKKLCDRLCLQANFIITTTESTFERPIQTYLKRIMVGVWNAINTQKQDLLYASSDQLPDVLPAIILKIKNPSAQLVARSYHQIPRGRSILHGAQLLSWFLLRFFSAQIITASPFMKKALTQHGFVSKKIHIIYPGISQKKSPAGSSKKRFDATFLSRIHASKGIFDLVDIWKKVVSKNPNAVLGIIGTGEQQTVQNLQNKIHKYNLQKSIKLLGHLSDQQARTTIAESSVFLFPSFEEGFCLTIAEVLLLGTPIISYDLPLYADIFPQVLTTVAQSDIAAFAKKTHDMLQNPKRSQTKTLKGLQVASQFTWEKAIAAERAVLNL